MTRPGAAILASYLIFICQILAACHGCEIHRYLELSQILKHQVLQCVSDSPLLPLALHTATRSGHWKQLHINSHWEGLLTSPVDELEATPLILIMDSVMEKLERMTTQINDRNLELRTQINDRNSKLDKMKNILADHENRIQLTEQCQRRM